MRNGFIILCGLFTLLASGAVYRNSGVGPRDSGPGTGDVEAERHTMRAQATTRAGLGAIIETNRKRVQANVGDGEAAVRLADALKGMARVNADA